MFSKIKIFFERGKKERPEKGVSQVLDKGNQGEKEGEGGCGWCIALKPRPATFPSPLSKGSLFPFSQDPFKKEKKQKE